MIIRSRIVVTMNGPPIENGAVLIEGPLIKDVGTFREIRARNSGDILDLGEQILLPGLINAHCHLDYTILRGHIPPQPSFAEWIQQINAAKAALSDQDYLGSIAEGFSEARRFGTTTIVNLEAFPQLLGRIPSPPIRTWWCAELIDVRKKVAPAEIVKAMRSVFEEKGLLGGLGLAPHAPYTASAELYANCSEIARRENLLLTTHLAESHEELEMFRDGRGPLFDFMKNIERPMQDCGSKTPLAFLLDKAALGERWLVAHVNEVTDDDFRQLTSAKKFHVVHSPRSHRYFGHTRFPLERLRALGFNVSLGTDSLATTSSLSLFAEMRTLQQQEPLLAASEIIEMATLNPAKALRLEQSLGRIKPSFLADLIAIPASIAGDPFEQILACETPIAWMMVDGRALDRG